MLPVFKRTLLLERDQKGAIRSFSNVLVVGSLFLFFQEIPTSDCFITEQTACLQTARNHVRCLATEGS